MSDSDNLDLAFFPSESALAVIESHTEPLRQRLHALRSLIIDTASRTVGVDQLEESVKWGEPSYRAPKGSPIRINAHSGQADRYALYVNCQTTLADAFRTQLGDRLTIDGSRAVLFDVEQGHDDDDVRQCIELALTYHQRSSG